MTSCCEEKNKDQIAVGIDFGTTNCLICTINNNIPKFIQQLDGFNLIPSKIFLNNNKKVFGHELTTEDKEIKKRTIQSIKRIIGLTLSDIIKIVDELLFKIDLEKSAEEKVFIICGDNSFSVEQIITEMFSSLVEIIRNHESKNHDIHAVITVPAYFDEKARSIIKKTATLAGLIVIRLINEPTAAAIAYSDSLENNKSYLVYDLGGGTFDISIIKKYQGNFFRVLGIGGDKMLGGDDFDRAITEKLITISEFKDYSFEELLILSKKIKEKLVDNNPLEAEEAEKLFLPIIEKTLKIIDKVIVDYKKEYPDDSIDTIILVGGSTRLEFIKDILLKTYKILDNYNPDEVVAVGAAIHAKTLFNKDKNHLLIDALGISLGLEIAGGGVEKFILKNSPIPISKTQVFTTQIDNQKQLRLSVCQGESNRFEENVLLGQFSLAELPDSPAGKLIIEVTFSVDADGILSVKANELSSQKAICVEFKEI